MADSLAMQGTLYVGRRIKDPVIVHRELMVGDRLQKWVSAPTEGWWIEVFPTPCTRDALRLIRTVAKGTNNPDNFGMTPLLAALHEAQKFNLVDWKPDPRYSAAARWRVLLGRTEVNGAVVPRESLLTMQEKFFPSHIF